MFNNNSHIYFRVRSLKISLGFLVFSLAGCLETFEPETLGFENILVVEAVITDEFIEQEVVLSRTTPLENMEFVPEGDATVIIANNMGDSYNFQEVQPGVYRSIEPFNAELNVDYGLSIITANGDTYFSSIEMLSGTSNLTNLQAIRTTNDDGEEGVQILVDGEGIGPNSSFFRYEYEETYQIKSFYASPQNLFVVSESPLTFETRIKEREERICYRTIASNNLNLRSSSALALNETNDVPIRFLPKTSFEVRDRYSIEVTQFIQSREVQSFYETLNEFSSSENVFSQTQAGFAGGNITANDNENKVLGIFSVASVSSQRIFFNFRDLFPDGIRPAFVNDCVTVQLSPSREGARLAQLLKSRYKLVAEDAFSGDYIVAPKVCVDCTVLGSNVKPDFWED
ncbi:DUF4249 domain-containing protein [Maribacter sp. 2210JD10-5]|uniref:DUF4249 domain-containing protein n=1 Tax=Maribacter sp. 2210JD10-5 TaxID=3386272 RepID=UPI0039BCD5BD